MSVADAPAIEVAAAAPVQAIDGQEGEPVSGSRSIVYINTQFRNWVFWTSNDRWQEFKCLRNVAGNTCIKFWMPGTQPCRLSLPQISRKIETIPILRCFAISAASSSNRSWLETLGMMPLLPPPYHPPHTSREIAQSFLVLTSENRPSDC